MTAKFMHACRFVDKEGYVGIDQNSGGYPYEAGSWNQIYFWTDRADAQKYADIWDKPANKGYKAKMRVVRVRLIEEPS